MNNVLNIFKVLRGFFQKLRDDHVSSFAAQASFFIILSLFPIILLLLSIIKYTPVTKSLLLSVAVDLFPNALDPLIISIIEEMYSMSSSTIISITACLAVWSASRGILSLIRGLNFIYHTKESRNYIHVRLIASLYTIALVIIIAISLVLLVFGNTLIQSLKTSAPTLHHIISILTSFKFVYMPVLLTLFFIMIYKIVPYERYLFSNLLPGALFSALGWILFSAFYSYYIENFAGLSYMYGSLTTVVFLMLWIYFGIFIFFIGAEINLYFMNHFEKLITYAKNKYQ